MYLFSPLVSLVTSVISRFVSISYPLRLQKNLIQFFKFLQERLVTNSGWKDYSRGNLNYAYENFEIEENGINSRRSRGNGTTTGVRTPGNHNSRSNGTSTHPRGGNGGSPMREHPSHNHYNNHNGNHHSQSYSNGRQNSSYFSSQPSGVSIGDTRSLQRPRLSSSGGNSSSGIGSGWSGSMTDPRTTYSLPRGSSAHGNADGFDSYQTTPDFYYLPSQRKYSGEVVRVYVDYNKGK